VGDRLQPTGLVSECRKRFHNRLRASEKAQWSRPTGGELLSRRTLIEAVGGKIISWEQVRALVAADWNCDLYGPSFRHIRLFDCSTVLEPFKPGSGIGGVSDRTDSVLDLGGASRARRRYDSCAYRILPRIRYSRRQSRHDRGRKLSTIDAAGKGQILEVVSPGVTISGLHLTGVPVSFVKEPAAILLNNVHDCRILSNRFTATSLRLCRQVTPLGRVAGTRSSNRQRADYAGNGVHCGTAMIWRLKTSGELGIATACILICNTQHNQR